MFPQRCRFSINIQNAANYHLNRAGERAMPLFSLLISNHATLYSGRSCNTRSAWWCYSDSWRGPLATLSPLLINSSHICCPGGVSVNQYRVSDFSNYLLLLSAESSSPSPSSDVKFTTSAALLTCDLVTGPVLAFAATCKSTTGR